MPGAAIFLGLVMGGPVLIFVSVISGKWWLGPVVGILLALACLLLGSDLV